MAKNTRGYTLIELLIVIVLIGVLAGIFLSINFGQQLKKARDGKRKTDIEQIRSALEMCRSDIGSYPLTSALVFGTTASLVCGVNTYLNPLPDDPKAPGAHYSYSSCATSPCFTYTLTATLEMGGSYTGTALGSQ